MKRISLQLDVKGLNLNEDLKKLAPQELVLNAIKNVCITAASQQKGFTEEDRRLYYKYLDAMEALAPVIDSELKDEALEKAKADRKEALLKVEFLEMEDNRVGFIRKCFREAKLMPDELLKRVESLILEVKDR